MRGLLLTISALLLLGCPLQGSGASKDPAQDSAQTAAPARGVTSALLPPQTGLQSAAVTKPKIVTQTVLPGQGPVAPNSPAQVLPLTLTEAKGAVLQSPSDRAEFAIWLPAGYPLQVEVHSYGEVQLELLDPQRRPLASGKSFAHYPQATGVHFVRASSKTAHGLHYTIVTR
jgi:hypothetical protein